MGQSNVARPTSMEDFQNQMKKLEVDQRNLYCFRVRQMSSILPIDYFREKLNDRQQEMVLWDFRRTLANEKLFLNERQAINFEFFIQELKQISQGENQKPQINQLQEERIRQLNNERQVYLKNLTTQSRFSGSTRKDLKVEQGAIIHILTTLELIYSIVNSPGKKSNRFSPSIQKIPKTIKLDQQQTSQQQYRGISSNTANGFQRVQQSELLRPEGINGVIEYFQKKLIQIKKEHIAELQDLKRKMQGVDAQLKLLRTSCDAIKNDTGKILAKQKALQPGWVSSILSTVNNPVGLGCSIATTVKLFNEKKFIGEDGNGNEIVWIFIGVFGILTAANCIEKCWSIIKELFEKLKKCFTSQLNAPSDRDDREIKGRGHRLKMMKRANYFQISTKIKCGVFTRETFEKTELYHLA